MSAEAEDWHREQVKKLRESLVLGGALDDAVAERVEAAEREARQAHDADRCGDSQWSCSYCETESE